MSPCIEERLYAFFRGQSSNIDRVPAASCAWARIGVSKIGFDDDFVGGKAAFNELTPAGFTQSDVHINGVPPSSHHPMSRDHRRSGSAGGAVGAIALVYDAAPRNGLPKARFTDLPVAKQERIDAAKPKIVQGLNDTNIFCLRGIVGGGRNQRKRVVEVSDMRSVRSEQLS